MVHSGQRDRVKLDYREETSIQEMTYTTGTGFTSLSEVNKANECGKYPEECRKWSIINWGTQGVMFFGPLAVEYFGGAGAVEKLVTGTPIAQKIIDKMNGNPVTSELEKQISNNLNMTAKVENFGIKIDGTTAAGKLVDSALGNNATSGIGLGETFKTFDIFKNGVATSIKSIDLNSPSYLDPAKNVMLNNMRSAIRAASNFESYGSGVKILNSSKIHTRVVNFVVNDIKLTPSQVETFKKALEYGKELGVEIQITIIK